MVVSPDSNNTTTTGRRPRALMALEAEVALEAEMALVFVVVPPDLVSVASVVFLAAMVADREVQP